MGVLDFKSWRSFDSALAVATRGVAALIRATMPDSVPSTPPESATLAAPALTPVEAFLQQCESDYRIAEITTVAHAAQGSKTPTHLLGIVELLPEALEPNPNIGFPPDKGGYPRRLHISERAGTFFVQRWHRPVKDAISWYRNCLNGSMAVPGYQKKGKAQDTHVALPAMSEDPPWPNVVVQPSSFWDTSVPLWGSRPGGARWHRLLPVDPVDISSGWSLSDWDKARRLLQEEIHIDLLSRSVLFGSCHLVLPNPVFSDSGFTVTEDWKSVALELTLYPGQTVQGLELIVWSQRPWGVTSITHQPITSTRTEVLLPEGVEETAHAIRCSKRGLLEKTEESGFIASVGMQMNIVSEERRVHVPARSKKHQSEQYTVGVSGQPETIVAGTPRVAKVLGRLAQDESMMKAREAWDQFRVQWFEKDATKGRQAIRDLIRTAHEQLDLLDPYFGALDLLSFAIATSVRELPVRILTSAEFCQMEEEEAEQPIENGALLLKALQDVRKQEPRFNIEIKVMPGQKSPIHDRFLIVDGVVWVLGSSLNEFGERGTLLVRLPNPPKKQHPGSEGFSVQEDVFGRLWSAPKGSVQMETLEEFVARRAKIRRQRTREEKIQKTLERCKKAYRDIWGIWRA